MVKNSLVLFFTCVMMFAKATPDATQKECCENGKILDSIKYQFGLLSYGAQCCGKGVSKVAFLAKLQNNIPSAPNHTTVVFQTAITNQGNGYDPSTGMFKCPRAGVYYFSWTTLTKVGNIFPTEIILNGKEVGVRNHGFANKQPNINHPSTQNAVVVLKKDDKVWIRTERNGGFCYGDSWTTFSGFEI